MNHGLAKIHHEIHHSCGGLCPSLGRRVSKSQIGNPFLAKCVQEKYEMGTGHIRNPETIIQFDSAFLPPRPTYPGIGTIHFSSLILHSPLFLNISQVPVPFPCTVAYEINLPVLNYISSL